MGYGEDTDDVGFHRVDERKAKSPKHLPPKNSRAAQRRSGFRVLEEKLDSRANLHAEVTRNERIHRLEPIELGEKLVRCVGVELVTTS
jgi:hypothetical protein